MTGENVKSGNVRLPDGGSNAVTVKELASELGVSAKYVWLMRAAGFPLAWRLLPEYGGRQVLTASAAAAREWIDCNEFRLVHCRPVMSPGQLRFGFQLENFVA